MGSSHDPIDLLFHGMGKLGPGSDEATLEILHRLPKRQFDLVVDAGCGSGRQTIVLARELQVTVHAIDLHAPFLEVLRGRAAAAAVEHLVQPHRMDMKDIPAAFRDIDLLWSEGAAYNIGFANALASWSQAIVPGGLAVVSELAWLQEQPPAPAKDFFARGYPDMRHDAENVAVARRAGYDVIDTLMLPREAWLEGYYDVLGPRAAALADHPDRTVGLMARETLMEIEIFRSCGDSFGYVFYVLRRA